MKNYQRRKELPPTAANCRLTGSFRPMFLTLCISNRSRTYTYDTMYAVIVQHVVSVNTFQKIVMPFHMSVNYVHIYVTTLCLQKGPTCKLSVTLSNRYRFSIFLHCWKAYKIRYKTAVSYTHLTLPTKRIV